MSLDHRPLPSLRSRLSVPRWLRRCLPGFPVAFSLVACGGDSFTSSNGAGGASSGGASGSGGAPAAGGASSGSAGSTAGAATSGGNGGSAANTGGGAGSAAETGGAAGNSAGQGGKGGAGGATAPCVPGVYQCLYNDLQVCGLDAAFVTISPCKQGLCDAKLGQCDDCKAGDPVSCADASTVKVCATAGKGGVPKACPASTPFCVGAGSCVECLTGSQCPAAKECAVPTCANHSCGSEAAPKGTVAEAQTAHDCKSRVCDGSGGVSEIADAADLPTAPSDPCLEPACEGTTATTKGAKPGTACNGGTGVCNGSGACGECIPGASRCNQNGVQTCADSGHWSAISACAAPTPVCSDAVCVGVTQVAVGEHSSCAVLSDETMRCWGGNTNSELGMGTSSKYEAIPQRVTGIAHVKKVAIGTNHACAITNGDVACWGDNGTGALGIGTKVGPGLQPAPLGMSGILEVAAGFGHSCAASTDTVYCWGLSSAYEVPGAPPGAVLTPQVVVNAPGIVALHAAGFATGLVSAGAALMWGNGPVGSGGTTSKLPTSVLTSASAPLTGVAAITISPTHACAEIDAGAPSSTTYCWGNDSDGQFGDGQAASSVEYATLDPFANGLSLVSAGRWVTCGFASPHVACAGKNDHGQIGIGVSGADTSFQLVNTLGAGTTAIAAGGSTICAIDSGQLYCWGQNDLGQAGVGVLGDVLEPTPVAW